jgi:hypothetical protein
MLSRSVLATLTVAAALAGGILLSGCGGDEGDAPAPARAPSPAGTSRVDPNVARAVRNLRFFQSPSGNISCAMNRQGARCEIAQKEWELPKPRGCDLDWGSSISLGDGPAEATCAGDTVALPEAPVLAYGELSRKRPIECTSSRSGVRCQNTRTGHGFLISRQVYRLF